MKTLILLAFHGFVLALSLAIPFNGDTAEAYNAESNDLARDVQADGQRRVRKKRNLFYTVTDRLSKRIIAYLHRMKCTHFQLHHVDVSCFIALQTVLGLSSYIEVTVVEAQIVIGFKQTKTLCQNLFFFS